MTKDYFERLKADLLATYASDLCDESVEDIKASTSLAEFIAVLNKYTAFLNYKTIPKVDWVRKWFGENKSEAEQNGCYIDAITTAINPTMPITLYGDTRLQLIISDAHVYQVTTQDNSRVSISTYGVCAVNVRQKDASSVSIVNENKLAKIKIRKV